MWFCFWVGQNSMRIPLCTKGKYFKKCQTEQICTRGSEKGMFLERISAVLLNDLMRVKEECFFPMQLSRKCSYCATLLMKFECTSWNGRVEWNYYLSEHICCANPSTASNQSRLSSQYCWGKPLGEMCISLFSFGPITMTDDDRTRGKDFDRA